MKTATKTAANFISPIGFHGHFSELENLRRNDRWAKKARLVAGRLRKWTEELAELTATRPCMTEMQCLRYREIYRLADKEKRRLFYKSPNMA